MEILGRRVKKRILNQLEMFIIKKS